MRTTFSVAELVDRWGISDQSIRAMERDGRLHRLTDMPGVRFSAAEVQVRETNGLDAEPMSVYERQQKDAEIKKLRKMLKERDEVIFRIGILAAQGGGVQ